MKKVILIGLLLIVVAGIIAAWIFAGPGTGFSTKNEYLYIRADAANKEAVLDSLRRNRIVSNITAFEFIASRLNYWDAVKPGRYEITKGSSVLSIVRMLRNGRQAPVNLTITKLRTKEDFARLTGNKFAFDSAQMISLLNNTDSMQRYNADTASALWPVIPDTYAVLWNNSPSAM